MQLHGSCHCGAVQFFVNSSQPYPFNLCYCSICRKTAGGGGYAINLGADHDSLQVQGQQWVRVYHAKLDHDGKTQTSPAGRHFCGECGSALWLWDPRWPELVHPFASAIDSPLPVPPERTHMFLGSKANWVAPQPGKQDQCVDAYPQESLAEWHQRLGLG